ncbi:MAG: hypothetical protein C4582_06570 [Desulfobacteraceae bacterium]|jgi:hypothetical protein|nr:MAG: hypothetical protein C4582_06570 [Desulfobacteraceae bacterium]
MITMIFKAVVLVSFSFLLLFFEGDLCAQEKAKACQDKALCAKMLQFGKEAYIRGRYLDAKEYFRKAVQADPSNQSAWQYYDQAVIFALAEKVEKDSRLVLPDTSVRQEMPASSAPSGSSTPGVAAPSAPSSPAPIPPPSTSPPKKDPEFKIIQDEGC